MRSTGEGRWSNSGGSISMFSGSGSASHVVKFVISDVTPDLICS
jgi:hypothetical protein